MVVSGRHTGTPGKCLQCISMRMNNVHKYTLGREGENHIQGRSLIEQTKYGLWAQNGSGDKRQLLGNCLEVFEARIWYMKII